MLKTVVIATAYADIFWKQTRRINYANWTSRRDLNFMILLDVIWVTDNDGNRCSGGDRAFQINNANNALTRRMKNRSITSQILLTKRRNAFWKWRANKGKMYSLSGIWKINDRNATSTNELLPVASVSIHVAESSLRQEYSYFKISHRLLNRLIQFRIRTPTQVSCKHLFLSRFCLISILNVCSIYY